MNFVFTGSFCAASSNASFATANGTPSASKSILPGSITAAQYSGLPLSLPIRTSNGFFVIGLSGKTRIHTIPSLFIPLLNACRAASSCRLVSQIPSRVFKAYEPKAIVVPLFATSRIRPFCAFLCLVLLGCNILELFSGYLITFILYVVPTYSRRKRSYLRGPPAPPGLRSPPLPPGLRSPPPGLRSVAPPLLRRSPPPPLRPRSPPRSPPPRRSSR